MKKQNNQVVEDKDINTDPNQDLSLLDKEVKEVAKTADKLIMVEMNLGQLVNEVKRVADGDAEVSLMGKIGGEIHKPLEILSFIKEVQGGK